MVQPKRRKSTAKKSKAKSEHSKPSSNTEPRKAPLDAAEGAHLGILMEVEDYAIMLLDEKGVILTWNKGLEKIKGYAAADIIGKNYRIFYTSEDRKTGLSDTLLKEAKSRGRTTYEGWRVRKDGSRFWGSMALTALHDASGALTGYLKITRDLTEKKIEDDKYSIFVEELKIKNEQLQASEHKYRNMVSEVQDYAIILLDPDGSILDWNKGAEKLCGYSSQEIIGKNCRMFYPKEEKDNKLPEKLLSEAKKTGSVVHEGWLIRKDGTRFWSNVAITALHNEDGHIIGFSKVTRDVTDKKVAEDRVANLVEELRQANDQLKQSEERYHQMTAEVQDYAIILLDAKGAIQNWNAGANVIKGYQADEIIGKSFKIFYSKEDRSAGLPDQLLKEAKRTGKVSHEGWRMRKDGSRFWGSVVITALHNSAGEVIGYSKVTRDLTERKMSEDALRSAAGQLDLKNKSLEKLNEELASFSNVASHDLKEPLRKIQTYADRIKAAQYDPKKTEDFLTKITDATVRMRSLIEDLLTYSQVSSDESTLEDIDLNLVIAAIKADLEIQLGEKKAVVRTNKLPVIKGVPHQMHQLFSNLISNAVKYSKPDTPPVIKIDSRVIQGPDIPGELPNGDNQYHHITVADNGIGFDLQESDRIFDPFFRLHPKGPYSGSGLGLSIVKKIVEGHHGIINAESEAGKGATFHIYFPKSRRG